MTSTIAQRLALLALVPLMLMGALLRPSAEAEAGFTARAADDVRLELSALKAEARSMTLHIDGP